MTDVTRERMARAERVRKALESARSVEHLLDDTPAARDLLLLVEDAATRLAAGQEPVYDSTALYRLTLVANCSSEDARQLRAWRVAGRVEAVARQYAWNAVGAAAGAAGACSEVVLDYYVREAERRRATRRSHT